MLSIILGKDYKYMWFLKQARKLACKGLRLRRVSNKRRENASFRENRQGFKSFYRKTKLLLVMLLYPSSSVFSNFFALLIKFRFLKVFTSRYFLYPLPIVYRSIIQKTHGIKTGRRLKPDYPKVSRERLTECIF